MKRLVVCAVVAIVMGTTALAQDRSPQAAGSLSELTHEVRLLRLALERSTQSQTKIQGISVYLSAQQSRVIQTSARVDSIRKDLDAAARDSRAIAARMADLRAALEKESGADGRAEVEQMLAALAKQGSQAATYEAQIGSREAEAYTDLQNEITRWSELIARLEEAIQQ